MNDVKFTLRPEWMSGLGKLAGTPVTSVSPFNMQATDLTPTDISELEKKGILDSNGNIASAYIDVIQAMAAARSFTRVRLTGGEGLFEYVTYATSEDGQGAFSLTAIQEGLEVKSPISTEETMEMLKQYVGDSMIRGTSFEAEVSISEAVVLAALIDMRRKAVLMALGGGTTSSNGEVRMEALQANVSTNTDDAQWLLAVINSLTDSIPEPLAVEMAVKSLQASNLIVRTASGIKLGRNLEILASRIPVIDKLLSLRSGLDLGNGQVVQVGFVCVQAGVNDVLMIESLGGRIHFEAVSPSMVLEYVNHFLNRPEVLGSVIVKIDTKSKAEAALAQDQTAADDLSDQESTVVGSAETTGEAAEQNQPEPKNCDVCGAKIPLKGKFCISCGTPVEEAEELAPNPTVCESCGHNLKPNAKFCNKCGMRVPVAAIQ